MVQILMTVLCHRGTYEFRLQTKSLSLKSTNKRELIKGHAQQEQELQLNLRIKKIYSNK
jgi:hypothetical protein